MDNLQHRTKARVAAIIDLILSILGVVLLVFVIIGAVAATAGANDERVAEKNREQLRTAAWLLWITVVILTPFQILQVVAVIKLFNATGHGKEAAEAQKLALFWRNTCMVFLVLSIVGSLMAGDVIGVIIVAVIRGGLLYMVGLYIKELGEVMVSGGSNARTTPGNINKV